MSQITDIKHLYQLFANLNIDFIDITSPEGSVSLSFGNDKPKFVQSNSTETTPSLPSISIPQQESVKDIVSPAVGIFERSNPRTGEYYIKLRDIIKVGQIIGHVLVLGVRHDVIADVSGKIVDILIEDEQPIEYGQPIIRLEIMNEEA